MVLVRWTITTLILCTITNNPAIQIMILLPLSVLFQAFIIRGKPYSEKRDQYMALLNECAASTYLYIMMLLTDYWGENLIRDDIGWALLCFLCFIVAVNLSKALAHFISYSSRIIKIHVVQKILKLFKKYEPQTEPTVAIKTEFQMKNTSIAISRSHDFQLDLVPAHERHMINSSDYATVSYTNIGRLGGIHDECINQEIKKFDPFTNPLNR